MTLVVNSVESSELKGYFMISAVRSGTHYGTRVDVICIWDIYVCIQMHSASIIWKIMYKIKWKLLLMH